MDKDFLKGIAAILVTVAIAWGFSQALIRAERSSIGQGKEVQSGKTVD